MSVKLLKTKTRCLMKTVVVFLLFMFYFVMSVFHIFLTVNTTVKSGFSHFDTYADVFWYLTDLLNIVIIVLTSKWLFTNKGFQAGKRIDISTRLMITGILLTGMTYIILLWEFTVY